MVDRHAAEAVVEIGGARRAFGAVLALGGVDFRVDPGECVGLVGHNGAGKSTLVNVINGGLSLDEGTIRADGADQGRHYSIAAARDQGIRAVFQELSLCPNLTVLENCRVSHPSLSGWGWRGRAHGVIAEALDTIFPGHGIDGRSPVGDLSIAERQMVEIAMAFSEVERPVRLVILDEPTSSLDAGHARQLLDHMRRFTEAGGALIFVSHILSEVLSASDRIVVMKDGRVADERSADGFTETSLVQAMGTVAREATIAARGGRREDGNEKPVLRVPAARGGGIEIVAHRGEIVGLAGLAGHGQTRLLVDAYLARSGDWRADRDPRVAFVAGDRHVDGVFPVWDILSNMSVALLPDLTRRLVVRRDEETAFGRRWRELIGIRTESLANPILSLSGGNQQKCLFARALATRAPLVLMDDPMRGVDVGTKQDVYAMLREEADKGRTFLWYSTETAETCLCDRVYVFREGVAVAELAGDEVSEENILAASFVGAAA